MPGARLIEGQSHLFLDGELRLRFCPRSKMLDGALGFYDPDVRLIVIARPQAEVGRQVVFIHEALHAVESELIGAGVLHRRVSHAFIENAALPLLAIFSDFGLWRGVGRPEIQRFLREHGEGR